MPSRMSDPTKLLPESQEVGTALYKITGNDSVPRTTIDLIGLRAGQIVASTYLIIRQASILRKAGESEERLAAVASWRDAAYYTDAERAALALVEAVSSRPRERSGFLTSCTRWRPSTMTPRRSPR